MWKSLDIKKNDLLHEMHRVKTDGYIESEMKIYVEEIHKLVQAELDRNKRSIKFIKDYFHSQEGRDITGPNDENAPDVLPGNDEQLPPIEKEEDDQNPRFRSFPRIELMYKNSLKVLKGEPIDDPRKKAAGFKKKQSLRNTTKSEDVQSEAPAMSRSMYGSKELAIEDQFSPDNAKIVRSLIDLERASCRFRLHALRDNAIGKL
mmetsp:Transcript_38773/g.34464  ORF Transcript_38773/g.34464 Transcript_38773/m.34464 type:complete len:204 (+) Transcript_38773:1081-1692(+)|eukprot:CAMPEP_0114576264 /NCGR_PEP_ID=MMETSP0125-20121206/1050_1 /TAXON_ID=485358 ORGANISM="Aristerostoma sp., Strain ATCC 50986" /NCGR_SAMPLE_ID=MMETSP0125 /ASSEMBLY_ACC=CAM_ASM_000245 /LENGTH=203 /DNA_ID=CAMNT_0001764653 /DNA_START=1032 /DNA_END=1643 /DNA_ORIENTATION=-